jgi:hypothetical protein
MPGRRRPWPLGALLLAAAAVLAVPLVALACTSEMATTVTLTSSENPSAYGDQVILTASVIPASGTAIPSGSVTFEDAGASLGTVTLGPAGQAALAESALGAGTQAITASYSGSTTFASSASAALEQHVTVQGSMTLLIPTVNPAPYGETLLFVVSVVPDGGTGVPTGTVTLMSDGSAVGTATLSGGTAAVVVSSLDAGGHALTADYPGDGNFSASASGAVTQTIDAASTATALTVSPTSAVTGQKVTLTATVTSPTASPTGTVTFSADGSSLGTATLSGGTASLVACFAHASEQKLSAAYAGTSDFSPSTSASVALQVRTGSGCTSGCVTPAVVSAPETGITLDSYHSDGPQAAFSKAVADGISTSAPAPPELITVGAAPTSVDAGQSVTLNSVVFGLSGAPFPSGTVDFVQGTALLGSAPTTPVLSTNDALAKVSILLSAGSYPSIRAEYVRNATAAAWYTSATSSSSVAVTVTRVAASTTLGVATSLNPSPKGHALIVTATVNHPSSSLTPTGAITFTANGIKPEAVAVNSLGQASVTLSTLAAGTQTISASYPGDENFAASSGSTTETVTASGSPTPTPQPTATPQPTSTPKPTATAQPTSTPPPTSTPKPGATPAASATPTATPSPKGTTTSPAPAAVIVPPATTTPPSRPSGVSGAGAANPDQFDTSAVPPIDLISLVSGIHMGNGLQIILFLVLGNALLIAAIVVAARRGRKLTRRSLEWAGGGADQLGSDPR